MWRVQYVRTVLLHAMPSLWDETCAYSYVEREGVIPTTPAPSHRMTIIHGSFSVTVARMRRARYALRRRRRSLPAAAARFAQIAPSVTKHVAIQPSVPVSFQKLCLVDGPKMLGGAREMVRRNRTKCHGEYTVQSPFLQHH